jgi:hypothetical protein
MHEQASPRLTYAVAGITVLAFLMLTAIAGAFAGRQQDLHDTIDRLASNLETCRIVPMPSP